MALRATGIEEIMKEINVGGEEGPELSLWAQPDAESCDRKGSGHLGSVWSHGGRERAMLGRAWPAVEAGAGRLMKMEAGFALGWQNGEVVSDLEPWVSDLQGKGTDWGMNARGKKIKTWLDKFSKAWFWRAIDNWGTGCSKQGVTRGVYFAFA